MNLLQGKESRPSETEAWNDKPNCRTVNLLSGGSITLQLNCNYLNLSAEDRSFINELLGDFEAYLSTVLPETA